MVGLDVLQGFFKCRNECVTVRENNYHYLFICYYLLCVLHTHIPGRNECVTVSENIIGDMVAQLVEHRPQDSMDSMTRGSNPVRSTRTICESFSESKMFC